MHSSDFYLCLLFFLCLLFSFTLKVTPVPPPRPLLSPVPSVLTFVQDSAIHSILPTAETFKAGREKNFQLLLSKTPFPIINSTNEGRFPAVWSVSHWLRWAGLVFVPMSRCLSPGPAPGAGAAAGPERRVLPARRAASIAPRCKTHLSLQSPVLANPQELHYL